MNSLLNLQVGVRLLLVKCMLLVGLVVAELAANAASVHWNRLSFGWSRKNSFIALPGNGDHRRLGRENCALPWEGVARGLIDLARKTRVYRLRCLYYSPSIDHFRVTKYRVSWSGDGLWLSLGFSFLDLLSGKKIVFMEGMPGGVPVIKNRNKHIMCSLTLIRK